MANEVSKQIYKPSMTVGQVYARPYGSTVQRMPIGNVLELKFEHDEDVQTLEDMTQLGGGTYAEVRRVKQVKLDMKLADLNVVNLTRAIQGTAMDLAAGAVVDEAHTVTRGGLIRLAHIQPTAVIIKFGADAATATPVVAPGDNFIVRTEGVYVLPEATELVDAAKVWVSYSYAGYATIEALTTKAAELELSFGGLNEADSGNPVVVDVFRASQGITKTLVLINKGFGSLDVSGTVLLDPNRVGTGLSKYYKVSMA